MSFDPQDSIGIPGQRCPACNTRNSPFATSCFFCGHALEPLAPAPEPPAEPARPTGAPVRSRATLAPVGPAQPRFDSEGNRLCVWCGAPNPPEAEACFACKTAFPVPGHELNYNKALLQLQLENVRVASDEEEAGKRQLNRWRWAAWAVSRIWRGPGM